MFNTKKEKYAYVQGLRAGARGKKPFAKGAPRTAPKSYPKRDKRNTPYRNKGQTDADWEDFFQTAVNRSYGTKQTASTPAAKSTDGKRSKSDQVRHMEELYGVSRSNKKTGTPSPKPAAKTKSFNQMSKSEQIRATERMKKAEFKQYLDDLLDVDRSLYLGMDDRGK